MLSVAAAQHYLTEGVFSISLGNAIVVGLMILVFVLALVLPFPRSHSTSAAPGSRTGGTTGQDEEAR